MLKCYFTAIVLIFTMAYKKNSNLSFFTSQNIVDTTIHPKIKKGVFDQNMIGLWCFEVKDSIDFSVYFTVENDSIFCNYINVMDGGNYLNARYDDTEWAFKLPIKIFDISKPIRMINFYNYSIVHLRLWYSSSEKKLIWHVLDKDFEKTLMLPKYLNLYQCDNNGNRIITQ